MGTKPSAHRGVLIWVMAISVAATVSAAPGGVSGPVRMAQARAAHTATLLSDGRVLVAGGFREVGTGEVPIASAEVYEPEVGRFQPAGSLNTARDGHTATLLNDGTVLIAGGWGTRDRLSSAELFDASTGTFTLVGDLAAPRQGMTATLLPDGTVLIAGGDSARGVPSLVAEIYDPATRAFAPAGKMAAGRAAHTATLLRDGTVLLAGGVSPGGAVLSSAEIYDPATRSFRATGGLRLARYKHAAAPLSDGDVLILGGSDQRDWRGMYRSTELYDAARGVFLPGPALAYPRFKIAGSVVPLADGSILVAGANSLLELYEAGSFESVTDGELDGAYYFATATRLRDGSVLVAGGYTAAIQPTAEAWRYLPRGR